MGGMGDKEWLLKRRISSGILMLFRNIHCTKSIVSLLDSLLLLFPANPFIFRPKKRIFVKRQKDKTYPTPAISPFHVVTNSSHTLSTHSFSSRHCRDTLHSNTSANIAVLAS